MGILLLTTVACAAPPAASGGATATSAPAASAPEAAPTGQPADGGPTIAVESNPAGDIPDNQVFVPFTAPGGAVEVSVPEGWARTTDGAATVFTDKFNSVRVEVLPDPATTDVTAARATEVPRLQSSVPGFGLTLVQNVQRKAGTAVLIAYRATSPVDPVTGKSVPQSVERYAFPHGNRQAVLTLSSTPGSDNIDPWRIVTDSLRWTS